MERFHFSKLFLQWVLLTMITSIIEKDFSLGPLERPSIWSSVIHMGNISSNRAILEYLVTTVDGRRVERRCCHPQLQWPGIPQTVIHLRTSHNSIYAFFFICPFRLSALNFACFQNCKQAFSRRNFDTTVSFSVSFFITPVIIYFCGNRLLCLFDFPFAHRIFFFLLFFRSTLHFLKRKKKNVEWLSSFFECLFFCEPVCLLHGHVCVRASEVIYIKKYKYIYKYIYIIHADTLEEKKNV